MTESRPPRITGEEFQALMEAEMPWGAAMGFRTETVDHGRVLMRLPVDPSMLRPGGTVAGPAMMALADATMYAVVLSMVGRVPMAVTTNLNINFLRRPPLADIVAEGRMIKLGKRLAVMEVTVRSDGEAAAVAHVTGTYSIPPDPRGE